MDIPGYADCVIGGGDNYPRTVPRSEATVEVSSESELEAALSGYDNGDVIYLTDDITTSDLGDISGTGTVILAGDRGINGSAGPTIEANSRGDRLMEIDSGKIRMAGIRLEGQYQTWPGESVEQNEYGTGLHVKGDAFAEVDNCELLGFSAAAVIIDSSKACNYHHNYVHNNAAPALGYGIAARHEPGEQRYDKIHNCYFNKNRHHINCEEDSWGYHAHHNVVGEFSYNHGFDCHGGPDSIAAYEILINLNTVLPQDSISDNFTTVRGKPRRKCEANDNQIAASAGSNGGQIRQRGETKYGDNDKYDGDETNQSAYVNMSIKGNEFDSASQPDDSVGAGRGTQPDSLAIGPHYPLSPGGSDETVLRWRVVASDLREHNSRLDDSDAGITDDRAVAEGTLGDQNDIDAVTALASDPITIAVSDPSAMTATIDGATVAVEQLPSEGTDPGADPDVVRLQGSGAAGVGWRIDSEGIAEHNDMLELEDGSDAITDGRTTATGGFDIDSGVEAVTVYAGAPLSVSATDPSAVIATRNGTEVSVDELSGGGFEPPDVATTVLAMGGSEFEGQLLMGFRRAREQRQARMSTSDSGSG
jgi:hypothetical protein